MTNVLRERLQGDEHTKHEAGEGRKGATEPCSVYDPGGAAKGAPPIQWCAPYGNTRCDAQDTARAGQVRPKVAVWRPRYVPPQRHCRWAA